MSNPINEVISAGDDTSPDPIETQVAWSAVIHVLVPHTDRFGTPVPDEDAAMEYISETLRGQFLDWGYALSNDMPRVLPVEVTRPYVEGSFTPGREGQCWRCDAPVVEQVEMVALDAEQRNDCPGSDEPGMPHEIDPPDGWED